MVDAGGRSGVSPLATPQSFSLKERIEGLVEMTTLLAGLFQILAVMTGPPDVPDRPDREALPWSLLDQEGKADLDQRIAWTSPLDGADLLLETPTLWVGMSKPTSSSISILVRILCNGQGYSGRS